MATEAQTATGKLEKERQEFRRLIVKNPNYFGNLKDTALKAVKAMVGNTSYEELTCVGFNPQRSSLEATIAIKRPFGYGGGLCTAGTTEYVRFFLDYGAGWEDAGVAGVKVHDLPNLKDCANHPDKPLTYVATLRITPKTACCTHPVLPKVHAILSWEWMPPAGPANAGWQPPWGNALDCAVQVKPHPWNIFCVIEAISEGIGQKLKVPPLFEQTKYHPIPLPDPPPFTLSQVAAHYGAKSGTPGKAQKLGVEPHRFGVQDLHAALSGAAFSLEATDSKALVWKSVGLDWGAALAALEDTTADVSYEELECLGLEESVPERLIATFRIKRPTGYSGDLCHAGSQEYVAFWADWDNTCRWTYLGTATVNVHDINAVPKEGLCYAAILPVDLAYHRQACNKPKIARIRAVLSWAVPPSTVDPDTLTYWGNRLDTHVQINPGEEVDPGHPTAKVRNIGGIAVEEIDTIGSGMTVPTAKFAHNPAFQADAWGLGRPCPFGRQIKIEGNYFLPFYYRVKLHKLGDPPASVTVLSTSFLVERWDAGFDSQAPVLNGFYRYFDPTVYFDRALAYWDSVGDDPWEVQLDIATLPLEANIFASSPWYRIQLDNTAPSGPPAAPLTMDIHITSGAGDCKDFAQDDTLTGLFIADDGHFGGWSLSTEPNTLATPSNQPTVVALASTDPAPAPGGHAWSLDTGSPAKMKPCGYVVRLEVSDRAILNSVPGGHNSNHIEVGFCLREKK
jgi:hypothetical protein